MTADDDGLAASGSGRCWRTLLALSGWRLSRGGQPFFEAGPTLTPFLVSLTSGLGHTARGSALPDEWR